MVIGSRQRLATHGNHDIDVFVNNERIKKVASSKSLGVTFDENLSWSKHIDNISKKVSSGISALKRIRCFISEETAKKVYQGLIEPHLSYCASIWDGMGSKLREKLQKLQIGICIHKLKALLFISLAKSDILRPALSLLRRLKKSLSNG